MRRSTTALAAIATLGGAGAVTNCLHAPPCDGLSCPAACPRNAAVDAAGRCACTNDDVSMLGACVPPPVAAAVCGRAATVGANGGPCVSRSCPASESLDVVSGTCVPKGALPERGALACASPAVALVEDRRAACVAPEAACPRGATLLASAGGESLGDRVACTRPPSCPPGSLPDGSTCRPIVTTGGRALETGTRVDVGAWAALAVGIHGGRGSAWLCRPLAQRPSVFAADRNAAATGQDGRAGAPSAPRTVFVAVAVTFPDQDISRLNAEVRVRDPSGAPLSEEAQALVSKAVETLLEPLRGLGGEASAAAVEVEVSCSLETFPWKLHP